MVTHARRPLAVVTGLFETHAGQVAEAAQMKRALQELDAQIAELVRQREALDDSYTPLQTRLDRAADIFDAALSKEAGARGADQMELLRAIAWVRRVVEQQDADTVDAMVARATSILMLPVGTPVVSGVSSLLDPSGWFGAPLAKPPRLLYVGSFSNRQWQIRLLLQYDPQRLLEPRFSVLFMGADDVSVDDLASQRVAIIGEQRIMATIAWAASDESGPQDYAAIRRAVVNAGLSESLCSSLPQ